MTSLYSYVSRNYNYTNFVSVNRSTELKFVKTNRRYVSKNINSIYTETFQ